MRKETFMASVEQTIEVNLPVRTVYNQWTQFEEFPRFMEGVEEVKQLDDTRLQWRASIAGKTEEWQDGIVPQVPASAVAWGRTTGAGCQFVELGSSSQRLRWWSAPPVCGESDEHL